MTAWAAHAHGTRVTVTHTTFSGGQRPVVRGGATGVYAPLRSISNAAAACGW